MNKQDDQQRHPALALGTVLVTLLALYVGWQSAGAGHGNFVWARILFPYACACMPVHGLQFLVIPFTLLQFPVYGLLVSIARKSHQVVGFVVSMFILHSIVVVLTFTLLKESF